MQNLPDLSRRLVVSSVIVILLSFLVFFSQTWWVSLIILTLLAALTSIGVWEFARLARAKEIFVATNLMIGIAIAVVLSFYGVVKIYPYAELPLIVLFGGVAVLFLRHFKKPSNSLVKLSVEVFGVLYLSLPLSFMLGILYPSPFSNGIVQDGRWWFVYVIITTKIIDTGAYFVGRIWGKRKLAPLISPGKTVEGAVAGFLLAVLTSIAMSLLGSMFSRGTFDLSLIHSVWIGMAIGILGQIGDLSESLLKRDAVVKDSNSLPGLGGVLDMVDSLIFTTPLLYFFMRAQV